MFEAGVLSFTAVLSWLLTGRVRNYSLERGILDLPNERSSHVLPTPRGGGLGIVVATLLAYVVLFAAKLMPLTTFMALFIGGALVAVVGFWDDCKGASPWVRIFAHIAAAIWALGWLGEGWPHEFLSSGIQGVGWAGALGFILILVWMLNLYNFMDGIDGIAAVEAVLVAGGGALILVSHGFYDAPLWLGSLAAGAAGFLVWNWPPAKIFMGDSGSGFLGFIIGALAASTVISGSVPVWTWLILLAVFVTDATFTLSRRVLRRDRWYHPHRSHAYQKAARLWGSHRNVTLTIAAINLLWLLPLAWISATFTESGLILAVIAFLPLIFLAYKLGAGLPE